MARRIRRSTLRLLVLLASLPAAVLLLGGLYALAQNPLHRAPMIKVGATAV